jgi:hypothetical protein
MQQECLAAHLLLHALAMHCGTAVGAAALHLAQPAQALTSEYDAQCSVSIRECCSGNCRQKAVFTLRCEIHGSADAAVERSHWRCLARSPALLLRSTVDGLLLLRLRVAAGASLRETPALRNAETASRWNRRRFSFLVQLVI